MTDRLPTTKKRQKPRESAEPNSWRALIRVFPGPTELIAINEGRWALGRTPGERHIVLDDESVSRNHAAISWSEKLRHAQIQDLGSTNGTAIDGRRVETAYLQHGAVLRVGDVLLAYCEVPRSDPSDAFVEILSTSVTRSGGGPLRALANRQAENVAAQTAPVLILGPTGSGKELLARRIHTLSGRIGKFVAVNCATLTESLAASELFGHVRGAFSGAERDRPGVFVEASEGTLFLDEFGELHPRIQAALLRTLQENTIRPLGADAEVPISARVVAATSRDLSVMERRGDYRSDLIGRLARWTITLPGLIDRREEILPLLAELLGRPLRVTPDAAEALLTYEWPRNVRDLQRVASTLEQLAVDEGPLPVAVLPPEIREAYASRSSAEDEEPKKPSSTRLREVLADVLGNVARAADELGVHRNQLYRWLAADQIDPKAYRRSRLGSR